MNDAFELEIGATVPEAAPWELLHCDAFTYVEEASASFLAALQTRTSQRARHWPLQQASGARSLLFTEG